MKLIDGFLDQASCKYLRERISATKFVDGETTVLKNTDRIKNNQQLDPIAAKPILDQIQNYILESGQIRAYARPRLIPRLMINKYASSEYYGNHVDATIMNGLRCDVSFTLFLSDKNEYDGGELVIRLPNGDVEVKPDIGSIVLYPAGLIHRVNPVTRGARIGCAGWIQSRIRDEEKRRILVDLDAIISQMSGEPSNNEHKLLMTRTILQLERMWDEF